MYVPGVGRGQKRESGFPEQSYSYHVVLGIEPGSGSSEKATNAIFTAL